MAKVSKSEVEEAIESARKGSVDAQDAVTIAMNATGETGTNTGMALENPDKQNKKSKNLFNKIGQHFKENPEEAMGALAGGLKEPLAEYRAHQKQKQAVPTAEELVPPTINLAEAFDI